MQLTAKPGHYSSVVGMDVQLFDVTGRMVGMLPLVAFNLDREGSEAMAQRLADALNAGFRREVGVTVERSANVQIGSHNRQGDVPGDPDEA